jgi:hypothetical protein
MRMEKLMVGRGKNEEERAQGAKGREGNGQDGRWRGKEGGSIGKELRRVLGPSDGWKLLDVGVRKREKEGREGGIYMPSRSARAPG